MNNPGYMLVLTGTPSFFPSIDEVFSPIIRQFKKIVVDEFAEEDDTKNCVFNPLTKMGLDPNDVLHPELRYDTGPIHSITGGRPYEIQLLCHFMFREIQEKRTRKMRLSLDVLDEVRKELTQSQSTRHNLINEVAKLTDVELRSIGYLCESNGGADIDDIWALLSTLGAVTANEKKQLEANLRILCQRGFLSLNGSVVVFTGDDFDKMYVKYYARKKGIFINFGNRSFPDYAIEKIRSKVFASFRGNRFTVNYPGTKPNRFINDLNALNSSDNFNDTLQKFVIMFHHIYQDVMTAEGKGIWKVVDLGIKTPWEDRVLSIIFNPDNKASALVEAADLTTEVNRIGEQYGYGASLLVTNVPMPTVDKILQTAKIYQGEEIGEVIELAHLQETAKIYQETKDPIKALDCSLQAEGVLEKHNPNFLGNIGYLYLKIGKLSEAFSYLSISLNQATNDRDRALLSYNLGIASFLDHKLQEAEEYIEQAGKCLGPNSYYCLCLLTPAQTDEATFTVTETFEADLRQTIDEAKIVLRSFQ